MKEMNNSDSVADELKLRTYTVMAHANPGKNNRIFSAILAFANSINDSGEVNTIQMLRPSNDRLEDVVVVKRIHTVVNKIKMYLLDKLMNDNSSV